MKTMILATLLATLPALAMAEGSATWIGPNGTTATSSGDCSASAGATSCQRATTVTGIRGLTATRNSNRTATADGVNRSTVTTGPAGRTGTVVRSRNR
ncbi:MAG: hypothetical protein ACRC14_17365 [Paracoccaceae bacterium]